MSNGLLDFDSCLLSVSIARSVDGSLYRSFDRSLDCSHDRSLPRSLGRSQDMSRESHTPHTHTHTHTVVGRFVARLLSLPRICSCDTIRSPVDFVASVGCGLGWFVLVGLLVVWLLAYNLREICLFSIDFQWTILMETVSICTVALVCNTITI